MDVSRLVERLCGSLLREALQDTSKDYLLDWFRRPSCWTQWTEEDYTHAVKKLKCLAFDHLILRKWAWFGSSEHPMCPQSRCLSLAYSSGCTEHVQVAIEGLKESVLVEHEAILQFLCLLAGSSTDEDSRTLDDSGLCLNSEFLFSPRVADVDSVKSSLLASQQLFECAPGTGFRGWSSQRPLDEDKKAVKSSLFRGLTHSSVGDINTRLAFPRLSSQPPNILPPPNTLNLFQASADSATRELERDCEPPSEKHSDVHRHWEGWEAMCGYLSEAPPFIESGQLAFHRTSEVGGVMKSCDNAKPGDSIRQLVWAIDHLPSDQFEIATQGCGQALVGLLQLLITYCRSRLATITETCTSDFVLVSEAHELLPLSTFVLRLVDEVRQHHQRFYFVNLLHSLSRESQGVHLYPLLLAMMSYALEPYFRFVEQWVFLGQLDCGVEFGIYGNQDALERRDEEYWRSGYIMASSCTPQFMDSHAKMVLTVGKALNLLKLCNAKHPLCSDKLKPLKLRLHFDADGLQLVHEECNSYSSVVTEQAVAMKKHQEEKLETERKEMREIAERQIAEALREAEMVKRAEEANMAELKLKKQSLFEELREQMETARAMKSEQADTERRNDAKMMEELAQRDKLLTQHEEDLAAEVRAELVAHYAALSKEAELRQARAEWKVKRLNLHEKRVELLHSEDAQWREAMEVWREEEEEITDEAVSSSTEAPRLDVVDLSHDISGEVPMTVGVADDVITHPLPADSSEPSLEQSPHQDSSQPSDNRSACGKPSTVAESGSSQRSNSSSTAEATHQKLDSEPSLSADEASGEHEPREMVTPDSGEDKAEVSNGRGAREEESQSGGRPANEPGHPRLFTTRGHAPKSTVEDIIYGGPQVDEQRYISTRGHAPPTTIQRLLYPLLHVTSSAEVEKEQREGQPLDEPDTPPCGPSSKFIDDYAIFDDPPLRDMLSGLLGPVPPDMATIDSSFLSLYPLDSLLETCIALPLTTQSQLVNKALLDHFMNSCRIKDHFVALKKFLLMEDGEFSHVLSSRLCEELAYSLSSRNLCSASFLNPLLSFALEASLHGRCPQAQRLAFKLKYQPSLIRTQAIDALSFLDLSYDVDWPLNIVITTSLIEKYNKVFQLLLQVKRVSWSLKAAFHHLRQSQALGELHHLRQSQALGELNARQLQAYRHEFQHFVNIMHGYVANQLFSISWREFETELENKVHSLDDLIKSHTKFLDNAIFRCLLSKKAKPVMNVVQDILSSILCFCVQSSLVASTPQRSYRAMCDTHKRFSDATCLLIKVISKLVTRGYQPHLEDLLLRLNFNNYYGQ